MLLGSKLGKEVDERINSKGENRENRYLTVKQTNYIYRKVESENLINESTVRQEIDQDTELDKWMTQMATKLIMNNAGKIESTLSQMEQWSVLSKVINYIQYDKHPKNLSQYVC